MWQKKIFYGFGLSVFVSLLSLLSGVFTPSASATSYSYDVSSYVQNQGTNVYYTLSDLGITFPSGFTPSYVIFDFSASTTGNWFATNFQFGVSDNGYSNNPFSSSFQNVICSPVASYFRSGSYSFGNSYVVYSSCPFVSSSSVFRFYGYFNSDISIDRLNLIFSDSLDADCPDCPTCPEIPANPYDDKLDNIYHAILLVGASFVVIMLLYQILRIYVRSWS